MNILAQIVGFIAVAIVFASYQQKNKKNFLAFQIFSNVFYGIQYGLLKAYSAVAMSFVSVIRSLVFYKNEKENKKTSIWILVILEIVIIGLGIITYKDIVSIMPIFIAALFAYGTWQSNLKLTYTIGIIISLIWILYNLIIGAYVSLIGNTFEFVASIMGLKRLIKFERDKK